MTTEERSMRRAAAAAELQQRSSRENAQRAVESLDAGLDVIRDAFLARVHFDVLKIVGTDSMMMPVAPRQTEARLQTEIELFQVGEAAAEAVHQHVVDDLAWCRHWLCRLRLGAADESQLNRLEQYAAASPEDRRRRFMRAVERTMPDSTHAPLIVYRLFPLAVALVAALGFSDHARAAELRRRQTTLLPSLVECRICRGQVLENGEKCTHCGNPFWKHDWLTAE
jgi:hypothetical protein